MIDPVPKRHIAFPQRKKAWAQGITEAILANPPKKAP